MANNGTIFQPSLPEPSVQSPVKSVALLQGTDSSLATAIKGATELGATAIKNHLSGKAEADFQAGLDSFVADEEALQLKGAVQKATHLEEQSGEFFKDGEILPDEALLINDARKTVHKWNEAFKKKRIPASEFRVKMEAMLKKYIVMAPGLASEFRQAASGVLGFDPTGSEFKAIEAQQRTAAATSDQVKKLALNSINKVGLLDPNLSEDRNIELFGTLAQDIVRREQDLNFQVKAANAAQVMTERTESQFLNRRVGIDLQGTGGFINAIADQVGTTNTKELVGALQTRKAELAAKYRTQHPHLDATKIDAALKPISNLIDDAILHVNGKLEKDILEARIANNYSNVVLGIQSTPEGNRFYAASKILKNLAIPPSLLLRFSEGQEKFLMPTKMFGVNGRQSPFDATNDVEDKDLAEKLNKWFSSKAKSMTANVDTNDPEQVAQFQNIIEGVMIPMFSDPDQVQAIEYDTVLKMAGDPKFVEVLNKLPNADRIKSKLARVTSAYTTAIVQKMGNEAFDNYDPRSTTHYSLKESLLGPDREKYVEIVKDQDGSFSFRPKAGLTGDRQLMAESFSKGFNSKYATRLNDAVKVMAHLKGHTKYGGMLDQLTERTPELFPFLQRAKAE